MFVRDEDVILRKEFFGGIAFHKRTGTTIELDKEAQCLLEILSEPHEIGSLSLRTSGIFQKEISEREIESILKDLEKTGFVTKNLNGAHLKNRSLPEVNGKEPDMNNTVDLKAPESVHLSITGKCNLNCPLCYEINGEVPKAEMDKEDIFTLIDDLARMKVFQLAIGGGEPFLREDIYEIIGYCRNNGIVPNITTNGTLINDDVISKIKDYVGGISVSLNGYSPKTNVGRDKRYFDNIIHGIKLLLEADIPTGVNFLLTKGSLDHIDITFRFLKKLGIEWINVLRFKQGSIKGPLTQYLLSNEDMEKLKRALDRWGQVMRINVDTAFTCLMYDVAVHRLKEKAVYGCVAGIRFCTVDCNGDVYPCSFFKNNEYKVGNVVKDDFRDMWLNSAIFGKFRTMRDKLKGKCSDCKIKYRCGGCRSIALGISDDLYNEDIACIKDVGG